MEGKYEITVLDISETDNASICAVRGAEVYEHPRYADIPRSDAVKLLEEIIQKDIADSEIKEKWSCLC